MILFDGIRFIYPENIYFDTSLTLLGVILMVLDNFDSFHRMADTHIPPILVFCLSHMKSLARKQFLDHENLCFDTFFVSLDVEIAILYKLFVFVIMAASGERHNGHLFRAVIEPALITKLTLLPNLVVNFLDSTTSINLYSH